MCRETVFSFANWTRLVSIREFFVLLEVFIAPLAIGMWATVWWKWFQLPRPTWAPKAITALTVLDMAFELPGGNLLYDMIPHSLGVIFHVASGVVRLGLRCWFHFVLFVRFHSFHWSSAERSQAE